MEAGAVLDEVFVSLQGEGGAVGELQLFLRMGGCPLRCRYCDTPRSWKARPVFDLHLGERVESRPNPVSTTGLEDALEEAAAACGLRARELPLAVTGGEPLLQVDFLASWLPAWPAPVLLETAGVRPEALARLLPHVARVSLDWKLASTLRPGDEEPAPAACAALLREAGVPGWVKVVVTGEVADSELAAALAELARVAPGVQVWLQPVTPVPGGPPPPSGARLLAWCRRHHRLPLDLRVLPQVHPVLGVA